MAAEVQETPVKTGGHGKRAFPDVRRGLFSFYLSSMCSVHQIFPCFLIHRLFSGVLKVSRLLHRPQLMFIILL